MDICDVELLSLCCNTRVLCMIDPFKGNWIGSNNFVVHGNLHIACENLQMAIDCVY